MMASNLDSVIVLYFLLILASIESNSNENEPRSDYVWYRVLPHGFLNGVDDGMELALNDCTIVLFDVIVDEKNSDRNEL